MSRIPAVAACSLLAALAVAGAARAEHARIQLDVVAPDDHATAFADQTPPDEGRNPRPVVHAHAGAPIRIEWFLTNIYPHRTLEGVVVHFFVAHEGAVGQPSPPDLDADAVVLETAFDMDFAPGGKAGARATVRIDDTGAYLIRVETLGTRSDHEHFSAIDLVIDTP